MDFIAQYHRIENAQALFETKTKILSEDILMLINNGFGSDPRIAELLDELFVAYADYDIAILCYEQDLRKEIFDND